MSLRDWLCANDMFEPAETGISRVGFAFPCNVCIHNLVRASDEPCRHCGHNANASACDSHSPPTNVLDYMARNLQLIKRVEALEAENAQLKHLNADYVNDDADHSRWIYLHKQHCFIGDAAECAVCWLIGESERLADRVRELEAERVLRKDKDDMTHYEFLSMYSELALHDGCPDESRRLREVAEELKRLQAIIATFPVDRQGDVSQRADEVEAVEAKGGNDEN